MTKTTRRKIEIAKLSVHPANVRKPESYSADGMEALKASIAALGLLQTPVVQALPGGSFGALIGGRRITALQALAAEGLLPAGSIECIVIDADVPHLSAMSLAENTTQERMHPLDEFAAFARMADEGMSIGDIARAFALTERYVRERLSYGRVHPTIRAAFRSGGSLDALKAYAAHPDPAVQLQVFESLTDNERTHPYSIRNRLESASIQLSNPRAQFVLDAYRAAGGPITEALFEDQSVLNDSGLVDRLLMEGLQALADAEKQKHGFAWSKALPAPDQDLLANYTLLRSQPRPLTEAEEARLDAIADRLDVLEGLMADAASEEEEANLAAEADALQEELNALQADVFDPAEAAGAGVIVWWTHNGPVARHGLVERQPVTPTLSDIPDEASETAPEAMVEGEEEPEGDAPLNFSARLVADLGLERAEIATIGLTQAGPLASKAALFAVAMIGLTGRGPQGLHLIRENAWERHSAGKLRDTPVLREIQSITQALPLDWLNAETADEQFRAFCALPEDVQERLLGLALGKLLHLPIDDRRAGSFGEMVAGYALTSIRDVWTPDTTFWSRLTRPQMLAVLRDLGLPMHAAGMTAAKKVDLVGYMVNLFAGIDMGLTEAQRAAVAAWSPHGMEVMPFGQEGEAGEDAGDAEEGDAVSLLAEAAE
ncbi:ParB/RepB/Spo0J family partition protein [Elstera sp.]|jgi:ParB family chromosome partitioning protein|uniref:ParB/RepB/Spo0J family partition protein n=1 Tax=Elstera sp. TaxID=1916664 RepID=UPI0037BFEE2E